MIAFSYYQIRVHSCCNANSRWQSRCVLNPLRIWPLNGCKLIRHTTIWYSYLDFKTQCILVQQNMASIKKMSSPNCMGIYNSHPTISRAANLIKLDNRAEVTLQYLVKVLPTTSHAAHVFGHALNDNVTHYWNVAFLIIHLSNGSDYIENTATDYFISIEHGVKLLV